MISDSTPKRASTEKVSLEDHLKVVHSLRNQIQPLCDYIRSVCELIPLMREPSTKNSLVQSIMDTVLNHGSAGLSKYRQIYIQGVNALGGNQVTFDGLKLGNSGYPKGYQALFITLRDLGAKNRRYLDVGSIDFAERNPVPNQDLVIAQACLTVLYWPYMLKLPVGKDVEDKLLDEWAKKISSYASTDVASSLKFGSLAAGWFNKLPYASKPFTPSLDLSKATYKSRGISSSRRDQIPDCLSHLVQDRFNAFFYAGPVGSVHLLSERAGKTRVITSYDGLVNCSNYSEFLRGALRTIPQDCSEEQSKGHKAAASMTASYRSHLVDKVKVYSVDLRAFTDNIHVDSVNTFLRRVGIPGFRDILFAPIELRGKVVNHCKPLMGLRGVFELGSLFHHAALDYVQAILGSRLEYSLCGDDLVIACAHPDFLDVYSKVVGMCGLSVNRSKTVTAVDVAIFCGEVFWRGENVSPGGVPFYTFSTDADLRQVLNTVGSKAATVRRGLRVRMFRCMKMLGRFIKGYFPYELPVRLMGGGIPSPHGLVDLINLRRNRYYVSFRIADDEVIEYRPLRLPFNDPTEVRLLPYLNLLVGGGLKRMRKPRKRPKPASKPLRSVAQILSYFYALDTGIVA